MKKIVLCAALLIAAAGAAHAVTPPSLGVWYNCDYTNYSGLADDPGYSKWTIQAPSSATLIHTYETFTVPYSPYTDQQKMTWAWKQDLSYGRSLWEATVNPGGPQCKKTIVSASGSTITFNDCTDGHSRVCWY
jgi:hypothetical protein